jgi:hypothetical protein
MGRIQPLHPVVQDDTMIGAELPGLPVASIVRCELCGAQLPEPSQRFGLVSPRRRATPIIACHTCRNAALGEGYRPIS